MVRFFPRTSRHQRGALAALACTALLSASVPVVQASPAKKPDPLKQRQHQVTGQINQASGDVDESSKQLSAATQQLQAAQDRLGSAQAQLAATQRDLGTAQALDTQMQARLVQAQADLVAAQAAVTKARRNVTHQRVAIGRVAADNYQYGDPSLMGLSAMLNTQNPADVTSQMNSIDSVMNQQNKMLAELRDAQSELEANEVAVDKARRSVAAQRQEAAANLSHQQSLEHDASVQAAAVSDLVGQRAVAQGAARSAKASDLRKLKQLKAEDAKIKKLILAAAAAAAAAKSKSGYNGETGGFLFRPVPGAVTSPYGWRMHPIYHYWGLHDGNDYSAPCGTPEYAAGTGRVISEYYSSVWGNRLLLDLGTVNGKNITVIYNHISRYVVGTGDEVKRGQVVADAGTTGWSTGCHLHFSVMVNGVAVDPDSYM